MGDTTNNQWGTITIQVPDSLQSFQDKINTTAEFLVAVLDIALTALELTKTFLVGYLDPIAALVQAIITEIEDLVTDMRQIGIYITGDWKLLEWPYQELKGGFQEYQRRMISRLTDLTDPTRPDVSANTKTLAMFFYLSVDTSEVQRVVGFIRQLLAFFGQSTSVQGSMPIPVLGTVQYGVDAIDIIHPKSIPDSFALSATPPSLAKIRWSLASTSAKSPFNPIPPLPPGGFIVSVSTLPDGLKVMFDSPQSDTSLQPSVSDHDHHIQPRDYGQVVVKDSGQPLILFGGTDMFPSSNLNVNGDTPVYYNDTLNMVGATRVYAQAATGSDSIIPLDDLLYANKKLLQRVFYVPSAEKLAAWATGEYGFVLDAQDMPYTCTFEKDKSGKITPASIEVATTGYVRVATCSKAAYDKQAKYILSPPNARGGSPYVSAALDGLSTMDIGAWSHPVRVTFPSADTHAYLDALKTALLVLVLSRPDLKLYDPSACTLEVQKGVLAGKILRPHEVHHHCGLEKMAHLADMVMSNYQKSIQATTGVTPVDFRSMLINAIDKVAHNIHNTTGSNSQIEKIVAGQTKYLRSVTWGDIIKASHPDVKNTGVSKLTLLDSLQSSDPNSGLAMNPYCIGIDSNVVGQWFHVSGAIQDRLPHMMEVLVGGKDLSMPGDKVVVKDKVPDFMATLNHGQQRFYEQFIQPDGSIAVEDEFIPFLDTTTSKIHIHGSADLSPVFFVGSQLLQQLRSDTENYSTSKNGAVFYCRGMFAKTNNGQIFSEASVALSLAASAIRRSSKDSAWIALRAFDILPSMDDFFATLTDWAKSLQKSVKSIVDTIKRYIEFIEGRLVEIQALIRRINDTLQGMVGFAFQIPQCSFLSVVSDGTYGVVGDLTNAKNKPGDGPLSYGAGIAVVIPFGPAIAMDLIRAIMSPKDGNPVAGTMLANKSNTSVVGIEGLPAPTPPGDEPPDVL